MEHVQANLDYVLSTLWPPIQQWIKFTDCMQNSIRICGKHLVAKAKVDIQVCWSCLQSLRVKGTFGPLSDDEEATLQSCMQKLAQHDVHNDKKARFLSRCHVF